MKKYLNLLLVLVIVASFVVGCGPKPPTQELNDAEAAYKAAQMSGADRYNSEEYNNALARLNAAKAKMAEAEKTGNKKLYNEAREELLAAIEDFEKAKAKAEECNKANEKLDAELSALKANMDAIQSDALQYKVSSWDVVVEKYNEAKSLADACKEQDRALALVEEANQALQMSQDEIAAEKAKAMNEKNDAAEATEMYTVVKGDSLWKISESKYADPFMWPLIYWANKAQIKDPDLIFPGQEFTIRKDYTDSEKSDAVNNAKTRGPWSLFDGK